MTEKGTEPVSFLPIKPGKEPEAIDLVLKVFDAFVAPQYSVEGIGEFKKFAAPHALADRIARGNFVFVAETEGRIVGVTEIRNSNHIALLFVAPGFQRHGVGKKLVLKVIETCRNTDPEATRITVNASPNAVDAYRKMGFAVIEEEKEVKGIRFVPMERPL